MEAVAAVKPQAVAPAAETPAPRKVSRLDPRSLSIIGSANQEYNLQVLEDITPENLEDEDVWVKLSGRLHIHGIGRLCAGDRIHVSNSKFYGLYRITSNELGGQLQVQLLGSVTWLRPARKIARRAGPSGTDIRVEPTGFSLWLQRPETGEFRYYKDFATWDEANDAATEWVSSK